MGLTWQPTRPVVVRDRWQAQGPGDTWTTVMTWKDFDDFVQYEGVTYGTKEIEFARVEALPSQTNVKLQLAVGGTPPLERLREVGWSILDSHHVSRTAESYRQYIQGSRGEFSVAKNVYVATRSGWFSCRSVCYLAAGLPVVVQDTGFSDLIPTGQGLFAFTDLPEAARALKTVESDYSFHQEAARDLARTHFDSDLVLGRMLEHIGLG